jgi:hypothetical protein
MQDVSSHIMKFYSTPIRDIYYDGLFPLPYRVGKISILPTSRLSPISVTKNKNHVFLHSHYYCQRCGEYKLIKSTYPLNQIEIERRHQLLTLTQYLDKLSLYIMIINNNKCIVCLSDV